MLAGFGVGFGARFVGSTDNISVGSMGFVRDPSDGHSSAYTVYDAAVRYDLGQIDASLRGASVSLNATPSRYSHRWVEPYSLVKRCLDG